MQQCGHVLDRSVDALVPIPWPTIGQRPSAFLIGRYAHFNMQPTPTEKTEFVDYEGRQKVAAFFSAAFGLLGLFFISDGGIIWLTICVLVAIVFLVAPKFNGLALGPLIIFYAFFQVFGFGPTAGAAKKSAGDFASIGHLFQSMTFGMLAILGIAVTIAGFLCWHHVTTTAHQDLPGSTKNNPQIFDDNEFEETVSGLSFKLDLPRSWFKEVRVKVPKDRNLLLYGFLWLAICWSLPEIVGLLFSVDPFSPGTGLAAWILGHQPLAFLVLIPLVAKRISALCLKNWVTIAVVLLMYLIHVRFAHLFYLACFFMMFFLVGVLPAPQKEK
jgi:hypothetical protein